APGFKPGAIKVVSLATWDPGIIVACRLATKTSPPRKGKTKSGPEYEGGLNLPGAGRYELLVFTSPQVELEDTAEAISDEAAQRGEPGASVAVRPVRNNLHQMEVEVDGNAQVDVRFTRTAVDETTSEETCRIHLSV